MGVIMGAVFGYGSLAVGVFILSLAIGASLESDKYDHQISVCVNNNLTYQKCGELYGWDLK